MSTEPRWSEKPSYDRTWECIAAFDGRLENVTDARLTAEAFLARLGRSDPPSAMEHWDDILLVVTELAANAIQYAPGPFVLTMRRTFDGVHVTVADTSTTLPAPRSFSPGKGSGGIGWYLIQTLSDQVSVVGRENGKDVHVFLPW
ncbi:ATP-binding protein [Streptomyces sp. enrichment culture]|uniref:ATP-binding protein n=1 Tax=Streptomyces sp. enrichment culture TaxID=1795815 RepID=UPI003F55961F